MAESGAIKDAHTRLFNTINEYRMERFNIQLKLNIMHSRYKKLKGIPNDAEIELPEKMEFMCSEKHKFTTENIPHHSDAKSYEIKANNRITQLNKCIERAEEVFNKGI